MSPYTGLRALAISRHNKVKAFSKEGNLIIVERIRDALASTTYLLYPWGEVEATSREEGTICDDIATLNAMLEADESPVTFTQVGWYPLEEVLEEKNANLERKKRSLMNVLTNLLWFFLGYSALCTLTLLLFYLYEYLLSRRAYHVKREFYEMEKDMLIERAVDRIIVSPKLFLLFFPFAMLLKWIEGKDEEIY